MENYNKADKLKDKFIKEIEKTKFKLEEKRKGLIESRKILKKQKSKGVDILTSGIEELNYDINTLQTLKEKIENYDD